jgi:hypothetical protein
MSVPVPNAAAQSAASTAADEAAAVAAGPRRDWSGTAAIIAAFVGFLALLVSGYTANLQRQQVRALVWPYLLIGYADPDHSVIVLNKGVGPAHIRAMQVLVDDKPQRKWEDVIKALGVDKPQRKPEDATKALGIDASAADVEQSTISNNVLSAGERIAVMRIRDDEQYERFRAAAQKRMKISACYCSTLGECWVRDPRVREQVTAQVEACPAWEGQFID